MLETIPLGTALGVQRNLVIKAGVVLEGDEPMIQSSPGEVGILQSFKRPVELYMTPGLDFFAGLSNHCFIKQIKSFSKYESASSFRNLMLLQ